MSAANRKEQRGWYIYDWANSGFATTTIALFLGPYLTVLAKAAADADGHVHPFGIPVDARSYWSYLVSLSVILQVAVLPVVGALADDVDLLGDAVPGGAALEGDAGGQFRAGGTVGEEFHDVAVWHAHLHDADLDVDHAVG